MITPRTKSKVKLDGNISDIFCKYIGKTSMGNITPEKAMHPIRNIELIKEALLKLDLLETNDF